MINYKKAVSAVISMGFFYGGYEYGKHNTLKKLQAPGAWAKIPTDIRHTVASMASSHIDYRLLDRSENIKTATKVLDAIKVPHGDMVIPSEVVHSRRYIVTQWQRTAVGASVIVLMTDAQGDLCVALGSQRNLLKNPQGYMETGLPLEDHTGLRAKNASRINATTGEAVPMDFTIEDNAVREVHEEIGISITKEQLHSLGTTSYMDHNPVCINHNFYVLLPVTANAHDLHVVDDEFIEDDLSKPHWIKIKTIENKDGKYYAPNHPLVIDPITMDLLNKALKDSGNEALVTDYEASAPTFRR